MIAQPLRQQLVALVWIPTGNRSGEWVAGTIKCEDKGRLTALGISRTLKRCIAVRRVMLLAMQLPGLDAVDCAIAEHHPVATTTKERDIGVYQFRRAEHPTWYRVTQNMESQVAVGVVARKGLGEIDRLY